jgi:FkbM family methyltransferase
MMKKIIKKIFNLFGLHICKLNVYSSPAYQIVKALEVHKINIVFDIGANTGQFASELREQGYTGKIVSFEPLSQAYKTLVKHASDDINWIVHSRTAVGATMEDCISINVAGNSVSSSILPMLETHINAVPESQYIHTEQVSLITLDSILEQYTDLSDNFFIKIDTQGYEWAVLDGAPQALKKCKGVLTELSLVPLYEGQKLWIECIERLKNLDIKLYSIQPGFTEPQTGKTLQVDGIFFKD